MNSNYDHLLKDALNRAKAIKEGKVPSDNSAPNASREPKITTAINSDNKVSQNEAVNLLKQEKQEKYSNPPPAETQKPVSQGQNPQELAEQLLKKYRGEQPTEQVQSKPQTRVVRTATGKFIRVPIKNDGDNQQSYTKGTKKRAKQKAFGGPNPPPEISKGRSILELQVPEHRREMFEKGMYLLGTDIPEESLMYTGTKKDAEDYPDGFEIKGKDGKMMTVHYEIGERIPYATKDFITSRGTGKSKNTTLRFLGKVYTDQDYYASLLMRNGNDHLKMTRTYYEGVLDEFCEYAFGHEAVEERMKWAVRDQERKNGDSYYRAVEYRGRERIFFFNLYHPSESKKADNPHREIFFEEAIPTKEQRAKHELTTKGGLENEESNYSLIFKSCDRDTGTTKKVFLGNPTVPGIENGFLVRHGGEELKEFNRWYGAERVHYDTLDKGCKGTGTKTGSKVLPGIGPIYLHLEKNGHLPDEFGSEDNGNWDLFATKLEDLQLIDIFINGSDWRWMFGDYICYYAKRGFYFFIHKNDPDISNKDEIIDIPERYIAYDQYFKSKQRIKEFCPKDALINDIKGWWDNKQIRFKGLDARDFIMEFAIKQPVKTLQVFKKISRL